MNRIFKIGVLAVAAILAVGGLAMALDSTSDKSVRLVESRDPGGTGEGRAQLGDDDVFAKDPDDDEVHEVLADNDDGDDDTFGTDANDTAGTNSGNTNGTDAGDTAGADLGDTAGTDAGDTAGTDLDGDDNSGSNSGPGDGDEDDDNSGSGS